MTTFESDEELRFFYGEHAVVSHKNQFTFIHLDNPSPEVMQIREKPDEDFACGCRTCLISEQNVLIVYMNDPVQHRA